MPGFPFNLRVPGLGSGPESPTLQGSSPLPRPNVRAGTLTTGKHRRFLSPTHSPGRRLEEEETETD